MAVLTDTINEYTTATGVTIDGVLIKDGLVDGVDVSATTTNVLAALAEPGADVVFNEDGHDHDFRVESDTLTHALFVQGSDGFIGIGCTPRYKFEVSAASGTNFLVASSSSVAHGMTAVLPTDAFYGHQLHSSLGNVFYHLSGGDFYPFLGYALFGTDNPTDTTAAWLFMCGKKDGTGVNALSATETCFQIQNYGTNLVTVLGSGNVGIACTPGAPLQVGAGTALSPSTMDVYAANRVVNAAGVVNIYTTDSIAADKGASLGLGGKGGDVTSYPFATIAGRSENNAYAGYLQLSTMGAGGSCTEWMRIGSNGNVGLGEPAPGTLFDMAGVAPYLTIHNTTEEDGAGGREGKLIFEGEQSGGELTTLGEIEFSHDGTSDDEKGKFVLRLNDGNDGTSPTAVITALSSGYVGIGADPATIFDVNGDSIRVRTSQTPASNGAGVQGEIAWDANYVYVCTATDTWKRAALTGGY
jgi:hypothetical protein